MRAIVLLTLFFCLRSYGQTNIISFTNASGVFVPNATAVKIAANKLMYTYADGGGVIRLDALPPDIQKQFAYDPTKTAAADATEQKKEFDATGAKLSPPFTVTNSAGVVLTNVVLVKLMPNKFIYETPSGAIGMQRLDGLPKDLLVKFGYNRVDAFNADAAEQNLDDADGIEIFHAAWYDVKTNFESHHVTLIEAAYDNDPVSTMVERQNELNDAIIKAAEKVIAAKGKLEEATIRADEAGQDNYKIEADVEAAQARTAAKIDALENGIAVYNLKKEFVIRTLAQPMLDADVEAAKARADKADAAASR